MNPLAVTVGVKTSVRRGVVIAFCLAAVVQPAFATDNLNDRIISIGGATTEIVYELGLGAKIVAVDTTSRFPPAAKKKPNVGYMRALSAEPIIALDPSIVLVDANSGPKAVLTQLREAGLRLVIVPAEPTVKGVFRKIRIVARALGEENKGGVLIGRLRAQLKQIKSFVSRKNNRPKVLFLLSVGNGGVPLTGGADTSADGIIGLAGGLNAARGFTGYKPISPEAIIEAAPDVLLITDRSLRMFGGKKKLLAVPSIAATPGGRAKRVVAMDGLLLLGFGPRIGTAISQLAKDLHVGVSMNASTN